MWVFLLNIMTYRLGVIGNRYRILSRR